MRHLNKLHWPYSVTHDDVDATETHSDIHDWLEKNVGIFRWRWNAIYGTTKNEYYFVDEKDAALFILRWT